MSKSAALALNHIGLTVPDIFDAIDWYGAVFGAAHIMGPRLLQSDAKAAHETPGIFGRKFRRAYQAHLLLANGVGLELFQFVEPPVQCPAENMPYWNRGVFHIAITHPDVDALASQIVAKGGKKRHEPINFVPGRPWRLCYCEDPWGNVIEIMSHSYAEVFSNWPQPGMTELPVFMERPAGR
ncbi:MAG: VOC family protein [Pseudorhodoplanes sp.]|jgi:predicted enzyme related to lactoylglutathione lyase|nr:VOC family protein [Pseudorhodoplanes sp.]